MCQSELRRIHGWLAVALACAITTLAGCDLLTGPETRLQRAESHIEQGNYRHAVIEALKVLEDDDRHAQARLLLARGEIGLGDMAAAEASLARALEAGAGLGSVSPWQAQIQLAFGRNEILLTQLETGELVLAEPDRSFYQGRAFLGLGRQAEAREAFERVLAIATDRIDARVGIAESQAASGDASGALARLVEIVGQEPEAALAWHAQGSLLLQMGRNDEAEQALTKALEYSKGQLPDPLQFQALAGQVEARLALGAMDRAGESLAELRRRAPGAPLTRFLDARMAIARQDFPGAIQQLTGLVNDAPGFVVARFLLGSALLAQGSLYQAEQQLVTVVQASPDNLEARKRLAEVRLRMNRPEAALALLSPALQSDSGDHRAEALLGAAQLSAGAEPTAILKLEQSVERDPQNRVARLDLATLYIGRGDADRAITLLQAIPRAKDDVRREFLLIRAIAQGKGVDAAKAEVDKLVRENAHDVGLLNLAANYLLTIGDAGAAAHALDLALAAEPGHLPSLIALGRARTATGELDTAEAIYRRALARDDVSVDARIGLAEISGRRGKPEEAKRWLEEVRTGDARAVASRLLLARLYLSGKESAKATKVVNEALAAAPGRADVLSAAGALYQDFGQHDLALGYFRKAADIEPQQSDHWLAMARAQAALGFQPAARESVERSLRLNPTSVAAVGMAVLVDLSEGKKDAALVRAVELRRKLPNDSNAAMIVGDVHSALGQHAEAERAYAEAGQLRGSLQAIVRQIQARQRAGLRDSTGPMREWLAKYPEDIQARAMHGLFLQQAGDDSRAIAEYERVMATGRRDPVTANNLAGLYFAKRDPRAEDLARLAYGEAPTSGAIADTLGWILVHKGAHDEGIKFLREAANLAPQEPEILVNLAEGLLMAGRPTEAREVLQGILAGDRQFASRSRAEQLREKIKGTGP